MKISEWKLFKNIPERITIIILIVGLFFSFLQTKNTIRQTEMIEFNQQASLRCYIDHNFAQGDSIKFGCDTTSIEEVFVAKPMLLKGHFRLINKGKTNAFIKMIKVSVIPEDRHEVNIRSDSLLNQDIDFIRCWNLEKSFSKVLPTLKEVMYWFETNVDRSHHKAAGYIYVHVIVLYMDIYNRYHDIYYVYKWIYNTEDRNTIWRPYKTMFGAYDYADNEIQLVLRKRKIFVNEIGKE